MLTLSPGQQGLISQRLSRLVTLWVLERVDGTIYRFTDDIYELSFGGNTYTPVGSFSSTARESKDSLGAQNLDIMGVINSSYITHDDLRAGRYRDAHLTEYVVDRKYPWAGAVLERHYWIIDVSYDGRQWKANIQGLPRKLQYPIGKVYGRTCRHTLGDTNCGIDLTAEDVLVITSLIVASANVGFTSDDPVNDTVVYGSYGARITGISMPMYEANWSAGIGRLGRVKVTEIIAIGIKAPNDDDLDAHLVISPNWPYYLSYTKSSLGTGNVHIELDWESSPAMVRLVAQGAAPVLTTVRINAGIDLRIVYSGGVLTCYYRATGTSSWTSFYTNTEVVNDGYLLFALDKNSFGGATRVVDILSFSYYQDLEDDGCVVTDVTDTGLDDRRIFEVSNGMFDTDFCNDGKLVWLAGGNNAGILCEVRDWLLGDPDSKVTLHLKTPFAIQVGDTFKIYAGCSKLKSVCTSKFNNLANFGGFPTVPGQDVLLKTPGSKQ